MSPKHQRGARIYEPEAPARDLSSEQNSDRQGADPAPTPTGPNRKRSSLLLLFLPGRGWGKVLTFTNTTREQAGCIYEPEAQARETSRPFNTPYREAVAVNRRGSRRSRTPAQAPSNIRHRAAVQVMNSQLHPPPAPRRGAEATHARFRGCRFAATHGYSTPPLRGKASRGKLLDEKTKRFGAGCLSAPCLEVREEEEQILDRHRVIVHAGARAVVEVGGEVA